MTYVIKIEANGQLLAENQGEPVALQTAYAALGIVQLRILEAMQQPAQLQRLPQGAGKIPLTVKRLP